MTLRPKAISFERVYASFEEGLVSLYGATGLAQKSGVVMYQDVYDMCTAHPKPFTELLFTSIATFLSDTVERILQRMLSHNDLVSVYAEEWESFRMASEAANYTCEYLNKMVLKTKDRNAKATIGEGKIRRQSVEALAFSIWKERIVLYLRKALGNRLVYQILDLVRRDREGDVVPLTAIAACARSLVDLNKHTEQPLQLYIEEFERPYLGETRAFYAAESAKLISSSTVSRFMTKANARLVEEVDRSRKICDKSSFDKILNESETQYVTIHQNKLQAEFETMVAEERSEDCTMAFSLLSRIPDGVKPLLEIYERYITTTGKGMIAKMSQQTLKEPREYVVPLLALHRKYMDVSSSTFLNSGVFVAAVDKAFRAIINDTTTNPFAMAPEVLARYCDVLLRKGTKEAGAENELEARMLDAMVLFKYVDDKDVFQKFYSRMLAKRLIYGTSASDEAEASMITHLKNVCGYEYTGKLQRMFTDMAVNEDLNSSFRGHLSQNNINLGVDFEVLILTAGSWPFSGVPTSEFQLPAECERSVAEFSKFYNAQHSGRKLSYLHNLSKADLRLIMPDKRYELSCSLYQAGVLLQFNEVDTITVEELRAATSLSENEFKRVMKALADVKLVLVPPEELQPGTVLAFNPDFSNKRSKLRLTASAEKESPQETETARQGVDEDRKLYIQAAIVRVMKSRKELLHNTLVQEVIELSRSRFAPSVPMIKKSIEQLIDKQYLERGQDNRDKYRYVA